MAEWGDGTRCVHAGAAEPVAGQPFLPGPVLAAPFHLGADDFYGRAGNPDLAGAGVGASARWTAACARCSRPAWARSPRSLRRCCLPGDAVVVPADGYYLRARRSLAELDSGVREVPTVGPWTPEVVAGARLVLLETPSNPGLDVCDISGDRRAGPCRRRAGRRGQHDRDAASASSRWRSARTSRWPATPRPSPGTATSFSATSSAPTPALAERAASGSARSAALAPGPFETWLVHRGLGTLDLRLARQAENAAALVAELRGPPAVARCAGRDRRTTPRYAIARGRCAGSTACSRSSCPRPTRWPGSWRTRRLVVAATSFGGLHSTADRRAQWGDPVPAALVRFSCGCEDSDDLVADVVPPRGALDPGAGVAGSTSGMLLRAMTERRGHIDLCRVCQRAVSFLVIVPAPLTRTRRRTILMFAVPANTVCACPRPRSSPPRSPRGPSPTAPAGRICCATTRSSA